MPKIDLTSHASSIGIMLVLNMVFLVALIIVYTHNFPTELRSILTSTFTAYNGALLLSLKGSADKSVADPSKAPEEKK